MNGKISSFRILTYNIHKAIGGIDRKYNLDRVIQTIRHYEADVVFMQEVDDGVARSRFDRQVDLIGDELGFNHRAFQANVRVKTGCYGNAILSHIPMKGFTSIDLTIPWKKRRQALVAELRIAIGNRHRKMLLCNTHLGLAGLERKTQLRKLFNHEFVSRTRDSTPLIIAGDLNDVWSSMAKKMSQERLESASKAIRTFPAIMPLRSLDAIYYRGELAVESCFAGRTKMARQASDHLPLIADFELTTR